MIDKINKNVNNPFFGRTDSVVIPATKIDDVDYCETAEVSKVVKTGEADTDFTIVKELRVVSKVDRQKYIQSFAGDVGVLNILKKIAVSGDNDLLNQREPGGVCDLSNAPGDYIEAVERVKKAEDSYNKIPAAIKGDMTKEDFVNVMTDELIQKKVDAYLKLKADVNDIKKDGDDNVSK